MRIIMSVVLAFIAMLAPAQEVKMKPLAPIEVEVSYELDQLCDYSQQVGESDWREKSTLLLEIGKGMVHSYVVEEHHKLIDQFVMQRSKNRWRVTLFNVHALLGETFMAYPKVGELTQIVNLDAAGVFMLRTFRTSSGKYSPSLKSLWATTVNVPQPRLEDVTMRLGLQLISH